MTHWATDSVFYHIYPLGLCGAPARNDFGAAPVERLDRLTGWLDHIRELGANAHLPWPGLRVHGSRLRHGRLLARRPAARHGRDADPVRRGGPRRRHPRRPRRRVQPRRPRLLGLPRRPGERRRLAVRDWFAGLRFDAPQSPYGDPFAYEGWHGHFDLVKLNLVEPGRSKAPLRRGRSLDRRLRHRRPASRRRRRRGPRLPARARGLVPLDRPRVLAVRRGRPRRLPPLGQPRDARLGHQLRVLQGPVLEPGRSQLLRDRVRAQPPVRRRAACIGICRSTTSSTTTTRIESPRTCPSRDSSTLSTCCSSRCPACRRSTTAPNGGSTGKRLPGDDSPVRPAMDRPEPPQSGGEPALADAIARLARLRAELPALRRGRLPPAIRGRGAVRVRAGARRRSASRSCSTPRIGRWRSPCALEAGRWRDALNGGEWNATSDAVTVEIPAELGPRAGGGLASREGFQLGRGRRERPVRAPGPHGSIQREGAAHHDPHHHEVGRHVPPRPVHVPGEGRGHDEPGQHRRQPARGDQPCGRVRRAAVDEPGRDPGRPVDDRAGGTAPGSRARLPPRPTSSGPSPAPAGPRAACTGRRTRS